MANNPKKPNYLTRVSKHIERKIFIETLQNLGKANYNISDYHYIGFGCYYYVDFILFHNFLNITKMTCLEDKDRLKDRMKFNKPFSFINLEMCRFADYIPRIESEENYIIWADYEGELDRDKLIELRSVVSDIKSGSVVIITVNVDSKDMKFLESLDEFLDKDESEKIVNRGIDSLIEKREEELFPHCGTILGSDLKSGEYPNLCARTIINSINKSLGGRLDDRFFQLFNYLYQDGTRMLTIGGIVDNKDKEVEIADAVKSLKYINRKEKPKKISVPFLTSREKLYLDQNINAEEFDNKFKLDKKEISNYKDYSRHYPTFYESFIG